MVIWPEFRREDAPHFTIRDFSYLIGCRNNFILSPLRQFENQNHLIESIRLLHLRLLYLQPSIQQTPRHNHQ